MVMPKVVDHEQWRREIAEAVWRVIRRNGVEGASVRTVAEEEGWLAGALRHYFGTQSELLDFAIELAAERIRQRIGALELTDDPRRAAATLRVAALGRRPSCRERDLAGVHRPRPDRSPTPGTARRDR